MYVWLESDSLAVTGGFTLFWLNLSPYYLRKETEQIRVLKTMWSKLGSTMKTYNDMVSKSTTSTSLDKDTWSIYQKRQAKGDNSLYGDEDQAPYFLPDTPASSKIKKIYL